MIDFIEIYSNDFLKIVEDKNKSIFKLEICYSNPILINSLIKTKIIQGATATEDYKIVNFKAATVKTFKQFQETRENKKLTINEIFTLIQNLTMQLNYLITNENSTIIGYSPENIIVINDSKFAFLGSEYITEIDDEHALISYPFTTKDFFISPEMLKIKEIPSYIHYKTSYFSLACFVLYALDFENEFYSEYINNKSSDKILDYFKFHPIKNTKIYALLSRCLLEEPKNRSILLI